MPRSTILSLLSVSMVAVALAACSASRESQPPPAEAGASLCDASKVDHFIGENLSAYVEREALTQSGAAEVRVLRPDDVATMDFNPRRLTIYTDPGTVVIKLTCG